MSKRRKDRTAVVALIGVGAILAWLVARSTGTAIGAAVARGTPRT